MNTIKAFCIGWFVAMTMMSLGLLPSPLTFIHIWQVELPAAIFLAACCTYAIARPPAAIVISTDEMRFIVLPIGAYVCWALLSAMWSTSWASAIHHAMVWSLYVTFYLLVRQLIEKKGGARYLGFAAIGYLLLFSTAAITGYISFLTFGGSNALGKLANHGEQVVTVLPLLLVTVVGLKGRSYLIGTVIITLLWLLVFCTFGRINLYLFVTCFVATSALSAVTTGRRVGREDALDAHDGTSVSAGSSLVKIGFISVSLILAPAIVQSFSVLSETPVATPVTFQRFADAEALGSSNNFRHLMNSVSREMISAHPLIGIGADNFGFRVNEYRKLYAAKHPDDISLREAEDNLPERAHNEFLQIAAELGAIGIVIVLWLAAGLVLLAYRACKNWRTSPLAVAAVIGIGAFCVSSLVSSYSFRLIQNGFFFFLVLAIAYRRLGSEAEDQERENALSLRHASRPRLAAVAGLLACIMMVAYWIPRVASAAYSNAANYTQDLSEAERLYRMAERLDAGNPDARYYHGMRLFQENKFAEAVPFMRDAISLGRARSADFSYLASSQSLAGDNAAAEQTMAEAWKLYPQSTFVMTRYAHEMRSNGNEAGAEAMFTLSLARNQRDANAWWTLFNEGSDAASDRAVKHPDQYTPLMDLRPLNALYAVRDERMMRFPEERNRLDMFR